MLVEAIVSFGILLIILGGITAIIFASNNMNKAADVKIQEIEDAAAAIETVGGTQEGTMAEMQIKFSDTETIDIHIQVKQEDDLIVFEPKTGD